MKHGSFITKNGNKAAFIERINGRNNRGVTLEPRDGILNVKKEFSIGSEVKSIILRATALGVFRLYVNGKRVGKNVGGKTVYDEMKPGWTDYRFRVFEFEYDITDLCGENNVLVCDVASGWWNGNISGGWNGRDQGMYGLKPNAFAGEIEIVYNNGESELISSDESWDVMIGGQVRRADIYDGQYDDMTLPHPSVKPEYYVWEKAALFDGFEGEIVPFEGESVCVRDGLTLSYASAYIYDGTVDNGSEMGAVKKISEYADGGKDIFLPAGQHLVIDFGQNMVGWPKYEITAARGTRIETLFGEMLNDSGERSRGNDGPEGSLYIENYRSALARYICIASGEKNEICVPSHVFYGFRYIEIFADSDITLHNVIGEVVGSDVTETGSFVCDNDEVMRLYSNVVWGMRGNYLSIPTDCPQRDERLGWTGDTQIFCGAASYLGDIEEFMRKWLGDARNSQKTLEGAYSAVIPYLSIVGCADAAWADAGIVVPYRLWLMYDSKEIISEHYDSMESYMKYLERFGLNGPKPTFGDWLNYDVTDGKYIGVCYYAYDALLMSRFSEILGKSDRAEYYSDLRKRIIAHWKEQYVKDGLLTIRTQTAHLLPLAFDMVDGDIKNAFINDLRELIVGNDYTLSTGFVGTGILNQTLCKVGLNDLAYSLLLQTKDPSWLYSVRQGATTVWERWNSYTIEKGFGDVGMNSFNHYAYGAVAEWFYSGICGINPDPEKPAFDSFILAPNPDFRKSFPQGQSRINSAYATYDSRAGRIESGWHFEGEDCIYDFVIPTGSTAKVSLISDSDSVCVNGSEVSCSRNGERVEFILSGGRYTVFVKN